MLEVADSRPQAAPGERAIGAKRRTFAIISHPDAGKTTLTERLLLFGGVRGRLAPSPSELRHAQ